MTTKKVIELYELTKAMPSKVDISYLRNNLNPILLEINPGMRISWACNSCVKNQMALLSIWLKETEVKKKKNVRRRKTNKQS
tara:strand:- start:630 stop:875 length:246 start_codon:yes stop_codon:yes gene_type:complete